MALAGGLSFGWIKVDNLYLISSCIRNSSGFQSISARGYGEREVPINDFYDTTCT